MNYFFFLDADIPELDSSVELFNKPPIKNLCKDSQTDLHIIAFYSDGKSWITCNLGKIKIGDYKIVYKKKLPHNFQNKSVFISMFKEDFNNTKELPNDDSMKSIPNWRSNIKIIGKNCSCSYQGEIPGEMTEKKISLVSPSPMLEFSNDISTTFILPNLLKNCSINEFILEILDPNRKVIHKTKCFTNTMNFIDLNKINFHNKYKMFFFNAKNYGGVPIYFSRNKSLTMMSIEHTHPPTSFVRYGDIYFFQKEMKQYWSEGF